MTDPSYRLRRAALAVGAAVVLVLPVSACSSGGSDAAPTTTAPQARYCAAWDDLVAAFTAFDDLDLVQDGLSAVQGYLDDLGAALQDFTDAADAKLGPKVDALRAAITGLTDAVSVDADPNADLGDSAGKLRDAWDDLVAELGKDCPDSGAGS